MAGWAPCRTILAGEAAPSTWRELWGRASRAQRRRLVVIAAGVLLAVLVLCAVVCGEIWVALRVL